LVFPVVCSLFSFFYLLGVSSCTHSAFTALYHSNISPFEVVYGFNPLTPLDLLPLPNPQDIVQKERVTKAEFVKKMHERIKNQIQQQTEKYMKHSNKRKREMIFEEGDWV